MTTRANYTTIEAAKTERVFDSLYEESKGATALGTVLDSAGAESGGVAQSYLDGSESQPAFLKALLDKTEGQHGKLIVDSVLQGMRLHEKAHGYLPTADVIEAALDQVALSLASPKELKLDGVGSTGHHDPISAMPEKIQIGLLSAIAEAFPAATYLPVGMGSNQALLGIVSHQAGSNVGGYGIGALLDGVNIGDTYLSSERRVALTLAVDRLTATGALSLTKGGAANIKLLRGRTQVFVNGFPVAEENPNVAATTVQSPISGTLILSGTEYAIGGSVNLNTGAVSLTFAPALPANTSVVAEGYIDFELQPELAPQIKTQVQTFSHYAVPWRGLLSQTIDSKTQYQNELGIDLQSESLMAARNQVTVERHRSILRKAIALGAQNSETFDFDYSTQMQQKTRAQIWQDLPAVLGISDQQMAEDTMDRGITHLYVGKLIKAQWESLPRDLFEPSGLVAVPGIYRIGRLFGRFEVYYSPWELIEGANSSQILGLGRSNTPARNTFVMGDAVPVTVLPTSFGENMKYGQAIYTRNFTDVNKHRPSASGCCLIDVINLHA